MFSDVGSLVFIEGPFTRFHHTGVRGGGYDEVVSSGKASVPSLPHRAWRDVGRQCRKWVSGPKRFSISRSPGDLGTALALGTAQQETLKAGLAPYLPTLFLCPL